MVSRDDRPPVLTGGVSCGVPAAPLPVPGEVLLTDRRLAGDPGFTSTSTT